MKIGPVVPEIQVSKKLKKKEITEGKIYSPVGRFAERAKQQPFAMYTIDWEMGR